jgi:hypothetical protein
MIKIIKYTTFLLLFSLLAPTSLFAEEAKLNANHPSKYYVKNGDTLWDISQLFLQNPWAWPEIWHINEQITDPHLIYAGDEISLVYLNDENGEQKPALMVTKRDAGAKIIKLSPEKRAYQITSTIPTIPLSKVESFLNATRVVEKDVLKDAAYVIAANEGHLVMGGGDTMYAMGDWSNAQSAYGVYRPGKAYIDPNTKEVLGYEARDLGLARYITDEDDVATFTIIRAESEIREYDKLLPTETSTVDASFYPKSPLSDIKGEIIRVFSGVKNIGQYDVVVINRGVREGVEKGDVFAIMRRGRIVRDKNAHNQKVQLPDEKSGLLMVFKTHEKVSLALVLQAKSILSVGDRLQKP